MHDDPAARWVLARLAEACTPRPRLSIAEWVERNIRLSAESNSPRPGPLSFADTPYLLAPLQRLDPADTCRQVNVVASAQSGKSTIGQAWLGWIIGENPGPVGVYLPSLDDARKYAEEKVQAIVDASPALKHRVRQVSSRSNEGSSTLRKRFTGGSLRIATASSPNALQMVSFRDLILEEIAGYEAEVGSRGSPIDQAKNRQGAWETRGAKTLQVSACGVQGSCPSTRAHEEGAAYEVYLACPHCAGLDRWEWEDMNAPTLTIGAHFTCKLCGGVVEHKHKDEMVRALVWIATYDDKTDKANPAPPAAFPAEERARWQARPEKGRQPSYRWWRYVSPFTTWDLIWAEGQKAKEGGLATEKTFWQQTLARAWDEGRDAPDHVKLHELREEYEEGVVPAGAYLLTGMADVQGDHVPWSVYAWGAGAEWWLIDRGKIVGDPSGEEVWKELASVLQRRYAHAEGGECGIELFGVDTGYKSNHVYKFCGAHPIARAMDGRAGWSFPPLGKPKRVKAKLDGRVVGSTLLYPTGTWSLKSELQYSLRVAIEKGVGVRFGGRGHFHQGVDQDYVRELVAEVLAEDQARGKIVRTWKLRPGFRNEETDIWVGARALAYGLGVGSPTRPFDFEAARAKIMGEAQSDLFAPRRAPGAADRAPPDVVQTPPPSGGWSTKHKIGARAGA
jgi:phage terminase large subunit GpA-like protein